MLTGHLSREELEREVIHLSRKVDLFYGLLEEITDGSSLCPRSSKCDDPNTGLTLDRCEEMAEYGVLYKDRDGDFFIPSPHYY